MTNGASITHRAANAVSRPDVGRAVLRAEGVSVRYGRHLAVDGCDMAIEDGSITALCGPNGSGKSTLLRALAGLQRVTSGRAWIGDCPVTDVPARDLARRVAFLPQQPQVPEGLTVREVVTLGRYPHRGRFARLGRDDVEAVARALDSAEIAKLADRPIEALSGGERQRAWLALTLAQDARILLLDEPTTFLDPPHQIGILRRTRALATELGLTVVWVLHDLNHAAAYSDRIVFLADGRITADGAPAAVMTEETLARVFGMDVLIMTHPETGHPLCVPRASGSTNNIANGS